jgi:hypothetical protein
MVQGGDDGAGGMNGGGDEWSEGGMIGAGGDEWSGGMNEAREG